MYEIEIGASAERELAALRAFEGRRVLAAIERELAHQPSIRTRNRKILEGIEPPFFAVPPVWELRVGDVRVFYDVHEEEKNVYVRAVRPKPPHKTTEEVL